MPLGIRPTVEETRSSSLAEKACSLLSLTPLSILPSSWPASVVLIHGSAHLLLPSHLYPFSRLKHLSFSSLYLSPSVPHPLRKHSVDLTCSQPFNLPLWGLSGVNISPGWDSQKAQRPHPCSDSKDHWLSGCDTHHLPCRVNFSSWQQWMLLEDKAVVCPLFVVCASPVALFKTSVAEEVSKKCS